MPCHAMNPMHHSTAVFNFLNGPFQGQTNYLQEIFKPLSLLKMKIKSPCQYIIEYAQKTNHSPRTQKYIDLFFKINHFFEGNFAIYHVYNVF